ncbi:uncharacterized protein LOC119689443 [Teleopsis dalmanni]|uniref:uncharacterized protein LOC119689443 n=1 Tax=Teleopsis dalmanni TaxID=139649 RepID=UPI0018CFDD17|nr:uncharacterized protein LOC119689443 [Teleopsis dalmanni]XP_037960202.1 uncharacterized protein LOC119689443 [Teleopsis dalmanni]XP_037960203.1 uncharacterized protein LOC119689443 [Teleopsis dalmanni]XP_037960204.1 uncharacterized protein LOC119689443 [Teleopsis dalmanni]
MPYNQFVEMPERIKLPRMEDSDNEADEGEDDNIIAVELNADEGRDEQSIRANIIHLGEFIQSSLNNFQRREALRIAALNTVGINTTHPSNAQSNTVAQPTTAHGNDVHIVAGTSRVRNTDGEETERILTNSNNTNRPTV